jgi:hypothetical protein
LAVIFLKTLGRLVPVVVLSLGLAACGGVVREIPDETDPDQTAVNQPIEYATLPEDANVTAETTSFTIEVTRLACASGVTGEVLEPAVEVKDTEVVIVARVARQDDGMYTCPSNDWVPITVNLPEPIGQRQLVDGECELGESGYVSDCEDSMRWDPESGVSARLF